MEEKRATTPPHYVTVTLTVPENWVPLLTMLQAQITQEHEESRYQYLERRPESWRRQLFVKGRNLPAGHVVRSMLANQRTPRETAENLQVPLEAVYECLRYHDEYQAEILADIQIEREEALKAGLSFD